MQMLELTLRYLLEFLLLGGGGLFLLRWLQTRLRDRTKRRNEGGIKATADLYSSLMSVLNQTPACRVMVLKSHNGGGVPAPGRELKTSVCHEVHDSTIRGVRDHWNNRPIDAQYADLLRRLLEHRFVHIRTAEIAQESKLRDLYESQGIKRSEVYYLCQTKDAVYYLSIVMLEDDESNARTRTVVTEAVDHIRYLFEQHHPVLD